MQSLQIPFKLNPAADFQRENTPNPKKKIKMSLPDTWNNGGKGNKRELPID